MAVGLIASSTRRLLAGASLVLAVVIVHGCVADRLASYAAEFGLPDPMPERIQVAYVREMQLAPPPVVRAAVPVPPPRRERSRIASTAPAASEAASAPEPVAEIPPPAPLPVPVPVPEPSPQPEPNPPVAAASEPVPAPVAAASQPAAGDDSKGAPFEWPGSTRLTYALTGNYLGEVHGQAQVEWIRVDQHYQMHIDVTVGLSFAPLMSRQMSSDGEITPQGLAPLRYDQSTKFAFQNPYRAIVMFEPDAVMLSNGQRRERRAGVQDTASQFVQLSWLLATQPDRLRVGASIEVPLALPRNLSSWVYEVRDDETVFTPFGEVQALHLVPQRVARAGGDLTTEIWVAPQLRYFPVRFRIHQDSENYVDLLLTRRPELAEPQAALPSIQPAVKQPDPKQPDTKETP